MQIEIIANINVRIEHYGIFFREINFRQMSGQNSKKRFMSELNILTILH